MRSGRITLYTGPALPHAVANIRGYFLFQGLLVLYLLITAAGYLFSP